MKFIDDIKSWLHDGDYTNPNDYPVYICVDGDPRVIGAHETAPKEWDVDGILHPDGSATKIWGPTGITTKEDAGWVHQNWPGCEGAYEPVSFGGDGGEEGGGCVGAGTQILTGDGGSVPIEEFRWAHTALSASRKHGPSVSRHVYRVFFSHKRHVLEVAFRGSERPLYATPQHRFHIEGRWRPIGFAHIGHRVLRAVPGSGTLALDEIVGLRHVPEPRTVHNIAVWNSACYFADGILVHNLKKNSGGDFGGSVDTFG